MSNDTEYTIQIISEDTDILDGVRQYLIKKAETWKEIERRLNEDRSLLWCDIMKEVGASHSAEVVTWGFHQDVEYVEGDNGEQILFLEAFANENSQNTWISSKNYDEPGELEIIVRKFPKVIVFAEFKDSFGSGCVDEASNYVKEYNTKT